MKQYLPLGTLCNRMSSTMAGPIKKSQRIANYGEKDVWGIFSPLSVAHKSINLGQGFPNFPAPDFVIQSGKEAIERHMNQYAPTRGLPHLLQVLAETYGSSYGQKSLDPTKNIMISQGANQGIMAAMQAHINPGEQVLLIEPFFDIYKSQIEMIGAEMVSVPLRIKEDIFRRENVSANDFKLDFQELEQAITPKTKILILNTPQNSTGKVFVRSELEHISRIAMKHNLLVISDEVYDQLYFDRDSPHIRIASLPGMWERTITVGSAGKTFGVTGWRVGWLIGPEDLIQNCVSVQARTVFCTSTPLQEAVALSFEKARKLDYFEKIFREEYREKRDILESCFVELGLPVAKTSGSFFTLVNFSPLLSNPEFVKHAQLDLERPSEERHGENEALDYRLCRYLTTDPGIGVTAIPPSAFYAAENRDLPSKWARFCFAKDNETLSRAKERLLTLKRWISPN
jgi:kynurenine aminotransferase